ncbi:hypothetical protein J437_LFUL006888 [Ladona fulva]|uniref:Uncharacterized protein n=1 Tax=Ladona fulva TaxID=123851 RepID=A0A8K0KHN9_LADFU|nr:hypothetical protein J437_LFUL006888 [Ladona fulva]
MSFAAIPLTIILTSRLKKIITPTGIVSGGGKTTRSTRSAMSSSNQSSAMITKSSSYGLHSQSLADQGFLTMKSKEIRDSESPTRDFSHLHNRQISTSTTHGGPGGGGYWYEESRSYHTGDDGAEVVQYGTRGGQQAFSSSSVIEYGDGGNTACRTGETALKSEQMSSSTKKEVSSSHQERSASSSYSFSSGSTQDWVQKHQDDESFVHDHSQPLQIESVRSGAYEESAVKEKESIDGRSSVHVEHTSKTERVSDIAENETRIKKEETESRRTTTEKFEEVESKEEPRGPKQKVTQRSKTGELPLEVNITKQVTTEITSSVPSTATSTPLPDSGPTPDVGSWTVVSGKQNGVCSSTDEFVFRSGTTTETNSTRDTTQRITTTDSTNDSTVILDKQNVTSDVSSTVKPSYSVPAAGKPTPVDSPVTSPSVEIKGIMKQTTTTTTTTSTPQAPTQSNYYIQTKRISTEVSPTHDAFARSLRSSPEKTQTYSTRASSKTSIDTNTTILSSPTRPQRISVTSPTGRSSSPEKGSQRPRDRSSPMKQQTPSPSATKEKRKLSSSLSKGIGGKRTATPGASPSVSPVRGRSPCSDDDEPRRRVGTSPEKKRTVTREGSPFSEPSRKSPGKEAKPSLRKTPEKSPARDTPDTHQESPRRKSSETTITKETKTTTSVGRRPSKGPKEERPAVRKPSTDRLTSPASSPMKDKSPDFPKEKKPGDDKTPTSPQRPKDLDLKMRPTADTKRTPSSPLDKSPTKQKEHDKPKEEKRKPSKDSTEPQKITPLDKESPKTHRISKADQPEEQFEVVCEAPETFDVKIITPIIHSVEYPTDEPEKRTKKTTVEEDIVGKKIEHELEIERLKRPSNIPVVIPTEEDSPQKATGKTPATSGITLTEEKGSESPREPRDSSEEAPEAPDTDSPAFRPTRKDSQPRKSPSKQEIKPLEEVQRKKSPSPVREDMKSSKKSPIRDSPVRDTQYRQSPSPSRDSPLRETKRPASPVVTPSRKSPARDSPRASSSSPAREIQRKQTPSPARDMPSSESPVRESPKKSPSPARNLPKSFSPSRQSPARGSPARDSPRKASPSRDDDSPKTYSPTRKQCTRDSPVRESTRKHSPSPAKDIPEKGYPRRHSPSPAKESPTRKSPARESPLRESPRQQSPSPARETSAKRPIGKSPERDCLRKSPARDTPTKPSKERQSPFRRRPEEKPSPEKSPARKPSIKDSSRKDSPVRKTPERDTMGKSPVRQSPSREIRSKTPERESPKKTPTKPSPAKETPRRDTSPKKCCDHDLPKKPSLTRKASDKVIPKRDTIARRSQSTEIPAAKRASPFKDSPKADDIPQKRAPSTQSPVRKSPPKETSVRKIPQYSSPVRAPTDSTTGDSPNANKPWRQTPVKAAPKDTPETPAKTPVKEYPPSGIPRTMSPARRPHATDSLPSSPDSPRQKEGRSQPSTSSPEKSPPSQRPSRSPERAPARKQPETSKPVSRIPGRAPASNITPPSQKRQAPTSSIPSYTAPLRRTPKDDCCPHHPTNSPKTEPKGTISRPQPGSRIPESNARRPVESSVDKKSTKIKSTTTVRKAKKPKKQRPLSGTDSEEEVSSSETEDDEKECVEERVTVTEKEVRSVSEVFMQDISDNHYPLQNGGVPDRPVSLSLITTATKTVTSGEEVQQTIDSEGNVIMSTYKQPSTITMSVSCKNTDYDGKEVTHTVRKTTYPDQPDEDEDVEILEIDDDDDSKQMQAIEYPYGEESPKVPKQAPTQTSPKRFGSPAKPIKKETKSQPGAGRRPTTESPVRRQPNELEPGKKRFPATATPSSPKQPTTAKTLSSTPKKPTQPIYEPQDENTSPKSPRKPGQISRLPAKQAPRQETKKVASIIGKTSMQKGKTAVTTMVSSTARQKSTFVSSTVEKTQPRQPLKGAPQPKQMKPAPKGKIPQKTVKGIPVKDTKKRVTNGHVPHSIEPEEDETEEEIDESETPLVSDIEKTEKYYEEEDIMDEEKDTISVIKVGPKPVEEKPQGLHPSTAFTAVTGIQTTTEIRQVSRESTPDAPGRRPRYADRVSEPDDDDVYYEEKGLTRITKRDQEVIDKKSVDQVERTLTLTMPRLGMVAQRYEEDEELREFERTEIEQRRQVRMEQVTDLDEDEPKPENEDDIEPANLSVASKVSRFLTASASAAAPPQPSQVPRMEPRGARRPSWEPEDSPRQPKGDEVDQKNYKTEELSSVAVKRARDIFETIAKTPSTLEPTPTTPKLKTDVLGKASLFETKQVDEINRIRTTQTLRKSFTGSDESLGEEGLPKEKPCTDYTESEEDYDEEPVEQIKESLIKKSQPNDTTPYKPQYERDLPRESSPGRTFKMQPEKDVPKETSPSRTFKPLSDKEAPKEPIRKTSKPLAEKPGATKEKPSLRDEIYDEPSDGELPEGEKPKKTTPYESSPKPLEPSIPKTTDTDAARRKNIFRDGTTPKEDEQAPKVKKTSIGSGMGREAFLKRMSKFASTEETKTVSTVKESPKIKPVSKFPSKVERDEPTRRPSKDGESPSRRMSTDSPTRRISRDEPECRRSPARDVSKPSTDTYTRRPSRDQPRSELESPRKTPTRETPSQPSESPRRTDTYTRKTSKEIYRNELESPRRTPTRETPTQQSETTKRLSTDTFTKRPRDRTTGDAESPRKTPTREMPSPARKPQEERRPSTDTSRRLSREFPKEDASERPKGATFTRRPSKDRVREEEAPKRPQDGTFTRKPKITEDDSPRPDDSYPRGSDTFTRRPSKDRQSPKRDSPMRCPEEDSPRSTGTYTRRTSIERFKESSPSPRSSPVRDSQPKKPEESPRRPSQDRSAVDKRRGSDTFTRRRSQPREDEPKKPESAVDALKPYLRTRTQEFQDDDIKLKPDDKTPKKLSSSRFETFTKRDSSTSVTKDDTKRLLPVGADRSPKKLSGSRFDTFTKRDSATSVKATESVVSRTKTTTRKSVEREVETQEDRPEYEESPKYYPEESPARSERKTPERTPEKIDKRPAERVERTPDRKTPDRKTPDRKTPDRKTPDRRDDSPASFGEPLRKKPSKEVEDEPVRKAPRPDDEEVEPRTSTRRRPSKEGSPCPEVKPDDEIPEQQRRRSSGGKFGVVLRQSSSVGSRVEALLSKVEKRTGSTTVTLTPTKRRPSKGPDSGLEIEEIFDLEFLEQMVSTIFFYICYFWLKIFLITCITL